MVQVPVMAGMYFQRQEKRGATIPRGRIRLYGSHYQQGPYGNEEGQWSNLGNQGRNQVTVSFHSTLGKENRPQVHLQSQSEQDSKPSPSIMYQRTPQILAKILRKSYQNFIIVTNSKNHIKARFVVEAYREHTYHHMNPHAFPFQVFFLMWL